MDKDDGDWSLHTLRPKRDRRRVSLLLASRAISVRAVSLLPRHGNSHHGSSDTRMGGL